MHCYAWFQVYSPSWLRKHVPKYRSMSLPGKTRSSKSDKSLHKRRSPSCPGITSIFSWWPLAYQLLRSDPTRVIYYWPTDSAMCRREQSSNPPMSCGRNNVSWGDTRIKPSVISGMLWRLFFVAPNDSCKPPILYHIMLVGPSWSQNLLGFRRPPKSGSVPARSKRRCERGEGGFHHGI